MKWSRTPVGGSGKLNDPGYSTGGVGTGGAGPGQDQGKTVDYSERKEHDFQTPPSFLPFDLLNVHGQCMYYVTVSDCLVSL